MPEKTILVTGDCITEHQIYEDHASNCNTRIVEHAGGAALMFKLLEKIARIAIEENFVVFRGFNGKFKKELPHAFSLYSALAAKEKSGKQVWSYSRSLGCSGNPNKAISKKLALASPAAKVALINDVGLYFRHATNQHLWPSELHNPKTESFNRVILTMSAPLANGDLWHELSTHFRDKLVVIVSLEDIIKEESGITTGISWERTLEELTSELLHNGAINDLLKCGDLIVRIGTAGALWVETKEGNRTFTAILDPMQLETCKGVETTESQLCFAAAITLGIIQRDDQAIPLGIRSGLEALRKLANAGYVQVAKAAPEFPYAEIATALLAQPSCFTHVTIPTDLLKGEQPWSIMGNDLSTNNGIARRVALFGVSALSGIPFTNFGKMTVVDRGEIESLRGLRQLIKGYLERKKTERPLSIAVFGAPGSGKSFGIKQIGKEILGPDCAILEFNLSQFAGSGELIGALHQVRDKVLEGTVPLVFWDEFDSMEYKWLQYLLAPMQDSKFQEGQLSHPIGKCIFIFAGGTSYTMGNFTPLPEDQDVTRKFRQVKGPDFVSRLNGYLNVLGPNRRQCFNKETRTWVDDTTNPDNCYPIRRALLLRSMLQLKPEQHLEIDQGILTALLEIDRYQHGARSLETVVTLTKGNTATLIRSNLPPEEQLSLHVDYRLFMTLVKRDLPFRMKAEILAPHIHEFYRKLCLGNGWGFTYDMDYEELPLEIKADNIAAAGRIPAILHLAGLKLEEKGAAKALSKNEYTPIITPFMERLAETEHNGWMEQKYRSGWAYGTPRDDKNKIHHALEEYSKLSDKDKEKDRDSVRHIIDLVENAEFVVVKAETKKSEDVKKEKKTKV